MGQASSRGLLSHQREEMAVAGGKQRHTDPQHEMTQMAYVMNMVRMGSWALVCLLSYAAPAMSGEAFTGYQIDNHGQYFGFLGVRAPLLSETASIQPFVQVTGAGLGYKYFSNGQERKADVQFASPSIGIKLPRGPWTLIALAGPQFRWKQEEQAVGTGRVARTDVGAYVQGEAFYWHEEGTFHAIMSYTDLDHFVWSRLRGTKLVHKTEQGCCTTYLGWDLSGMGNKDFYAVQTGPLLQIPIHTFYLTLKTGYQYNQTFHGGVFGGIEVYTTF